VSADFDKRPLIGLGDLIRAAVALDASPEECVKIAALLDLPRDAPLPAQKRRPPPEPTKPPELPPKEPPVASPDPGRRAQEQELGARFDQASTGAFKLVGPTRAAGPVQVALEGASPLEPAIAAGGAAALPYEPLFARASARNILTATLSVEEESGSVDAGRLVAEVASQRAVTRLPRRRSATLRRGAYVLIDRSDTMEPFHRDVTELLRSLERLLGDRLSRFTFDGAPLKLFRWDDGEPWTLSAPAGTPLLIISDLGLRRPHTEEAWLAFTDRALRMGCLLFALVPYPPSRWPRRIAQRMRVVTWDRATTVADAWRAARSGRARR
jgi:hypothetical protein